ncbi:MAG: hypothetical protein GVY04_06975 [Cyanobacteria bacterium]|nr:hypothetical protein [Cyanobacteria bacterium GSL.Bin1]
MNNEGCSHYQLTLSVNFVPVAYSRIGLLPNLWHSIDQLIPKKSWALLLPPNLMIDNF